MERRVQALVAVLGLAVVVLTVALVGVMRDSGMPGGAERNMGNRNASLGMMQAMGDMDSDTMLVRMREILGEDGNQRMLTHMQAHRSGMNAGASPEIDGMMHQLMDGMMQQMPDDDGHRMPHASVTPTPGR